ncbi:PRANC domain-containing protein [Fusarium bulbicola]|nr:PRANC domain-containing protein [Fusarium bulbicola]
MESPSPSKTSWDSLPSEIRLLIIQSLMQDGYTLACLAAVSRAWLTDVERCNFTRIKITPSRLMDFHSMIRRNKALCAPRGDVLTTEEAGEALNVSDTEHYYITTAFQDLFSILSQWDQDSELMLDISIYSPSDARHWFPYLTFVPDSPSNRLEASGLGLTTINQSYHDPPHGWVTGFRHSAPPPAAVNKDFHYIMEHEALHSDQSEFEWWNQLPSVSSVTSILLRQQNRRRWEPIALAPMLARFPRLQEIHYEPWRRWDIFQPTTDKEYLSLFETIQHGHPLLKRLVVFENFNQQYPVFMQRFLDGEDLAGCESIRNPVPAVGRVIALTSLPLEHLAASFIIDASHFFAIDPSWEWPNLTSLVLTSRLLKPEDDSTNIDALLQAAAAAALKMPRLETMEIWNGQKGLAALFQYRMSRGSRQARIIWRGTWKYHITPSVLQAWEAVGNLHASWRLDVVQEQVEEEAIQSHGDGLHHLMLSGQAIRSVSLQQIRREQKFLEGVEVLS